MTGGALEGRHVCAALLAIGAVLLTMRLGTRRARIAWSALLIAALAHTVWLNARAQNLVNLNLVHHYLGAKYALGYADFYRAVNAAIERPQVSLRDLEHPAELLRDDLRQQRAYYVDLLREGGANVDATLGLAELRQRALDSGAVRREAERILGDVLPRERIEPFRADVRRALVDLNAESNVDGEPRLIGTDYGFNGSPLYAALRHVDPTLYAPFGRATAWMNLAWQIAATLAIAWMLGAALALDVEHRLACAALLFASWDCVGWALSGLVFAGLWLPLALALLAWRRGHFALSGACIAWAGLIKLFPFVLLLPHVVRAARAVVTRASARSSLLVFAGAAVTTPVLVVVGMLSGRSWLDFWTKIVAQFQSSLRLPNSVSASDGLCALGIFESQLQTALAVLALLVLTTMLVRSDDELEGSWSRRSLVLFGATGWLTRTWLNYYALAPLVLLPAVARTRRWSASVALCACALSCALPEFGDAHLARQPWLQAFKVAPYALIPLWLTIGECDFASLGKFARRSAVALAAIALLAVAAEAWRWREIRRLALAADEALEQGAARRAFDDYGALVALVPNDAVARTKYGLAAARVGRTDEATAAFERAVELAPRSASAHKQLGVWRLEQGELDAAATELETARALAPCDEDALFHLARVRLAQGRTDEARAHVVRALELTPKKRELQQLLAQIDAARR